MRCSHPPSHSTAEARDQRSQWANRQAAFLRCVEQESFQKWLKRRTSGAVASLAELEAEIAREVERAMAPEHLLVEVWDGTEWVPENKLRV